MKDQAAQHDSRDAQVAAEVPFGFDEIFFSRTDERGRIIAGNRVFQRVSLYCWDEMLDKPHNIVRHPDMPRAVFWLLWETIRKGEAIGAYVKNRAKDGRYYWVFALVTPIAGGYLSVRIKPSSAHFTVAEREYLALVAEEQRSKMKPAESGALLLQRLAELGFRDYQSFMSTALAQECLARDERLGRTPDRMIAIYNDLARQAEALMKHAEAIFDAYGRNSHVPLNMRVQAAQLEEAGETISVIASNYTVLSGEIQDRMDDFVSSAKQMLNAIDRGRFLVCVAKVQREAAAHFADEDEDEHIAREQEVAVLEQQQRGYESCAEEGLREVAMHAEEFYQACSEMTKLAAGLEVTRVMGKVESVQLMDLLQDGFAGLIDDLERFQTEIATNLKEIERLNRRILSHSRSLLEELESHKERKTLRQLAASA